MEQVIIGVDPHKLSATMGLLHERVTVVTCPTVWIPVAVTNWLR